MNNTSETLFKEVQNALAEDRVNKGFKFNPIYLIVAAVVGGLVYYDHQAVAAALAVWWLAPRY